MSVDEVGVEYEQVGWMIAGELLPLDYRHGGRSVVEREPVYRRVPLSSPEACSIVHPASPLWWCTEPKGHDGMHRMAGGVIATWPAEVHK